MPHSFDTDTEASGLCAFVDASPSPFHACAEAGRRLATAGFSLLAETEAFPAEPGRYYLIRGGSLVAWNSEAAGSPSTPAVRPFRVVGAHTDSPNLRIKPQPDLARAGWQLLGVEIYGGPLFNSWLDRDLGLSGRVAVRGVGSDRGVQTRLVTINEPVLRVAQLAVHLDRGANEGLALNPQQHLTPIWGVSTEPGDFREYLGAAVGAEAADVLSWDVMTHDLQPSRRIGRDLDLISAPRLDNLATSYAGLRALIDVTESMATAADTSGAPAIPAIPVLVLFDHEEVGSQSERGAMSTLLPTVLERIVSSAGGGREDFHRALAGTVVASGDMAHATHPNYPEKHEPQHPIAVNGGPVLKTNVRLRYATDSVGAAMFLTACDQAGVPVQQFVSRNDMPCGSTVGPMTAALVGATTVDFGAPMLSMHSARELCGARDPAMYAGALAAFLNPQT
jgi:aspartyl aminopeptidase